MATRQPAPKRTTASSPAYRPSGTTGPSGGGNPVGSGWLMLGSIALVGTYFAASWAGTWAATIGQPWVEAILGGSIGGGDGGDPPCKDLPTWLCSVADFDALYWGPYLPEGMSAVIMLLLFVGFLCYWLYLILRMPVVPTWQNHLHLSKAIKPSSVVVILVVLVANSDFLMTYAGHLLINSRTWSAFITAIIGFAYIGLVALSAPSEIATMGKSNPSLIALNRTRAPVRYFLSLLAAVFLLNTGFIASTLIPNALAAAPPGYNWWCVLWPFGCELGAVGPTTRDLLSI